MWQMLLKAKSALRCFWVNTSTAPSSLARTFCRLISATHCKSAEAIRSGLNCPPPSAWPCRPIVNRCFGNLLIIVPLSNRSIETLNPNTKILCAGDRLRKINLSMLNKLLTLIAATALFFAAVNTNLGAQEKIKVVYSSADATNFVWYAAQDGGFYKKHGLGVELIFVSSSTTAG